MSITKKKKKKKKKFPWTEPNWFRVKVRILGHNFEQFSCIQKPDDGGHDRP